MMDKPSSKSSTRRQTLSLLSAGLATIACPQANEEWQAIVDQLATIEYRAAAKGPSIDGTFAGWRVEDFTAVTLNPKFLSDARSFASEHRFFRAIVDACRSETSRKAFTAIVLLNALYPEHLFDVKLSPFLLNAPFIWIHTVATVGKTPNKVAISVQTLGRMAADHWERLELFGAIELVK